MAAAEFVLQTADGVDYDMASGSYSVAITGGMTHGNGVEFLFDGNSNTEWSVNNYDPGGGLLIFLNMGTPIEIMSYRWVTGLTSRDPTEWTFYGDQVLLDTVTGYTPPIGRGTSTERFYVEHCDGGTPTFAPTEGAVELL